MPQGPQQVAVYGAANSAVLNCTADTVLKTSHARLARVFVNGTGTASGMASAAALYDASTTGTGGTAAGVKIAVVPNTVGPYMLDVPCATGLRLVPSAGAVLTVTLA